MYNHDTRARALTRTHTQVREHRNAAAPSCVEQTRPELSRDDRAGFAEVSRTARDTARHGIAGCRHCCTLSRQGDRSRRARAGDPSRGAAGPPAVGQCHRVGAALVVPHLHRRSVSHAAALLSSCTLHCALCHPSARSACRTPARRHNRAHTLGVRHVRYHTSAERADARLGASPHLVML